MVTIKVFNNYVEIKGHTESKMCSVVSLTTQYICMNLKKIEYVVEYGYLYCKFVETEQAKSLIDNFVKFIKGLQYTGYNLIDNRK